MVLQLWSLVFSRCLIFIVSKFKIQSWNSNKSIITVQISHCSKMSNNIVPIGENKSQKPSSECDLILVYLPLVIFSCLSSSFSPLLHDLYRQCFQTAKAIGLATDTDGWNSTPYILPHRCCLYSCWNRTFNIFISGKLSLCFYLSGFNFYSIAF